MKLRTSMYAWITPVVAITTTAPSASGENRASAASSNRLRSPPSNRRVAAGSANSRHAIPPTHTLPASTCRTSDGKNTAGGLSMLAWPARAGVIAR